MREHYPLEILLPIAKLARSTFFYHRQSKPDRDSTLKARIRDIKQAEPNYGYRRVSAKLVGVNHKREQRLIQEMGLQVRTKKLRKYSSYKGEQGKIAPNQLQRDFSASKPNEKWLTDITEFRVKDEKLYFSPILDCFNNELIAYGLSRRSNGMLVQEILLQAVEKLPRNVNLILHSHQGIHYQIPSYQRLFISKK